MIISLNSAAGTILSQSLYQSFGIQTVEYATTHSPLTDRVTDTKLITEDAIPSNIIELKDVNENRILMKIKEDWHQ